MSLKRFKSKDGLTLSYTDSGEGNVILCLPGLTRNHTDFDDFLAKAPSSARIIALTFRGRKPSEFSLNPLDYNVFQEAEDTIALLDHLDIDRAMIIGTSRGGIVSMVLAELANDRLTGVVLNDVGPKLEEQAIQRISDYLGTKPTWSSLEEAIKVHMQINASTFPNFDSVQWKVLIERWYPFENGQFQLNYDPNLKIVFDQTPKDIDLWPAFDQLDGVPLGLIWGMNSDLLTEETVNEMRKRRPDLSLGACANRGHVPLLNEPEAVAVINEIFIKSFT